MKRFTDKVQHDGECWMWTGAKRGKGYGVFWYEGKNVYAHRTSFMLYRGEIPEGSCVLHRCDRPACVNPAHLFLGTVADNNRDMLNKGRQVRGESQGFSKLTEDRVRYIRASKEPCTHIARRWGMDPTHIQEVRRGMWWKHVRPTDKEN